MFEGIRLQRKMNCTSDTSLYGDWLQESCSNLIICIPNSFASHGSGNVARCSCEVSWLSTVDAADGMSCKPTTGTYILIGIWGSLALCSLFVTFCVLFVAYCSRAWKVLALTTLDICLGCICLTSLLVSIDLTLWIVTLVFINDMDPLKLQLAAPGVEIALVISLIFSLVSTCRVICLEMHKARMCSDSVVKSQGIQLIFATIFMICGCSLPMVPSNHFSCRYIATLLMACVTWTSFRRMKLHLHYNQQFRVFAPTTVSDRKFKDLLNCTRVLMATFALHGCGSLLFIINTFVLRSYGKFSYLSISSYCGALLQNMAIVICLIAMAYATYSISYDRIEKASKLQTLVAAVRVSSTTSSTQLSPRGVEIGFYLSEEQLTATNSRIETTRTLSEESF
jgi:hypothetical protein